ncbi:hypothetical protein [Paenibacillus pini]|uniref:Uncharacterized protein n=1 Tax=Paenibacillus pini JCM 16418 TaxID=1236976 RepID=W7YFZ0_9BACL|nr:hypothetical protein [Paenibacillus pini]GAF07387.1 hypothetical protein JCM16418_1403 [Paenibacillus pini JCM 16418]
MLIYMFVILVAVIGGIGTLLVGMSQENKKSNPDYYKKTKGNISKLFIFYVAAILVFVLIWIIILYV